MDMSKLPKLSQTPAPPPSDDDAPPPAIAAATSFQPEWCRKCHAPNARNSRFCASCGAGLGGPTGAAPVEIGAEAWISIAVGAILLFLQPRLIQFLASPASFAEKWQFTDELNQPLPYRQTVFFWGDIALTSFALVLIVEGLVIIFGRKPRLVLFAFVLTSVATFLNFAYVAAMMTKGYGFQLMSGLAVAFGVYIALYQYRLWKSLRVPVL